MTKSITDGATSPFPGLTILPFEPGMDMESFRDLLQNVISELYQNQSLVLHSKHNTSHRSPNSPRDEWAPDHYWHSDQSYGKKRPYATALYGNHIEGAVAGTNFIDTQKLLSYIAIDDPDLFAQLKGLSCVFSWSSYFDRTVHKAGPEAIEKARKANGLASLNTIANIRAIKYPAMTYPMLQTHPITGKDTLYFDERVVRIVNIPRETDVLIQKELRSYFELDPIELAKRPYFYEHKWEPGQMVLFTNTGTLHCASPGNEGIRTLHRSLVLAS